MADIDILVVTNYAQWSNPAHNDLTRATYLNELTIVVQNWTLIGNDLFLANLNLAVPAQANIFNRLRYLLRYYYDGGLAFATFIGQLPVPLNAAVAAALVPLTIALPGLGVSLTQLGENLALAKPLAPGPAVRWAIPSSQTLELLTQAKWLTLAGPPNLFDLKAAMLLTTLVTNQRALPPPLPPSSPALPIVTFVCQQHSIIRCSSDNYVNLNPLRTDARSRRLARYGNPQPPAVAAQQQMCNTTIARWQYVKAWSNANIAGFGVAATARNLTNLQYNDIVEDMYGARAPLGPPAGPGPGGAPLPRFHGYVHLGEPGRAFFGSGVTMSDEMSRCWKCRFTFHYNILYPVNPVPPGNHLNPEDPRLTQWAVNPPLSCAEDLTHFSCAALGGGIGAAGVPPGDYMFPPY